MFSLDTGQSGELQHSQRLPTQFAQGAGGHSTDQSPGHGSTAGTGVDRGGNAEGAGLGDRFAQKVNQRVMDAVVADAADVSSNFMMVPFQSTKSRKSFPVMLVETEAERLQNVPAVFLSRFYCTLS